MLVNAENSHVRLRAHKRSEGTASITKRTDTELYVVSLILVILFLINNLTAVRINRFLYILVVVFAIFTLDKECLLLIYALITPMNGCIPVPYITFVLLLYIIMSIKQFDLKIVIPWTFIAVQELILSTWYTSSHITDEVWLLSTLGMFWMLISLNKYSNIRRILKWYVAGTTIMLTTLLLASIQEYGIDVVLSGNLRLGYVDTTANTFESARLSLNANEVGFYSICGASIALLLAFDGRTNYAIMIASAIVTLAIGVLSLSRTYMLCLVATITLFALSTSNSTKEFIRKVGIILLIVLAVRIFMAKFPYIISSFESRLINQNWSTAGARQELFDAYNAYLLDNPSRMFFGIGVFGRSNISFISNNVHNGFQQTYVCWGIIGALVFWTVFLRCISMMNNGKNVSFKYYIPLITTLLFIQTIQLLYPYAYMVPLGFSALCIRMHEEGFGGA